MTANRDAAAMHTELPQSVLVGLCTDCELYTYPPEKTCPGSGGKDDDPHHYRKRRMFICPLPDHCEGMAYFKLATLKEHMNDR